MIRDDEDAQTKNASKGIDKSTNIEYENYLSTLYSTSAFVLPQSRMQYNKRLGSMTIVELQKSGLNPIYTKMFVADDLITISPLKKNDEYI